MTGPLPELRARFTRALRAAGAARVGAALFDELVARYAEPGRHYHTLSHVEACLAGLDRHRRRAERPAEVELALWLHDAVYDVRRGDNEERSAALARARLGALGVPAPARDRVARTVEATKDHAALAGDSALVIDLDLTILAAPPEGFDRFERQVRAEYAHVPETLFRAGRLRVLEGFLARPAIFAVPELRGALEACARANLERRVRALAETRLDPLVRETPAGMA